MSFWIDIPIKHIPKNLLQPQSFKDEVELDDIQVPAPAEGKKDLAHILEKDFIEGTKGEKTVTIETPHGNIKLEVGRLNVDHSFVNKIILTTAESSATWRNLYVDLNRQNQPVRITCMNNSCQLFASLLKYAGCNYLAKLIRVPNKDTFSIQIAQLRRYEKAQIFLEKTSNDKSRIISPKTYNGTAGIYVNQKSFKVLPLSIPLATKGLAGCSALVIIDKAKGQHYMAHIDGRIFKKDILRSLNGLDLSNSEIYIMKTSNVIAQKIIVALMEKGVEDKVKFISGNGYTAGIVSYNGEVFLGK